MLEVGVGPFSSGLLGPLSALVSLPAPVNTVRPGLTGTPQVGQLLTSPAGTWSNAASVTRQWLRDGFEIEGQTASTYLTDAVDDGADISCREIAVNGGQIAFADSEVVTITYAAPVAGTLDDIVFAQGTGEKLIDVGAGITGDGMVFEFVGSPPAAVTLANVNSGLAAVDTTNLLSTTAITVRGTNSGGFAEVSANVSVEAISNQVLRFDGNDGLRQPVSNFYPTDFDATGFWAAGYAYFDGTNWDRDAILSFGSSTSAVKQMSLQTNGVYVRGDGEVTTQDLGTPSTPGWHFCVMHVRWAGTLNDINVTYWRNADTYTETNLSFKTSQADMAQLDQVALGHRGRLTQLHDALKVPACGFAWGYGDPTAMQAWALNGGDHRDLRDYNFAGDATATLESYWAGHRVDDASAFDHADIVDEVGPLDTWTNVGALEWAGVNPPWNASGVASIQSVVIEDAARNELVVTVQNTGGAFLPSPTIAFTEADFDLWTEKGYGPIRVQSASAGVTGGTATVTLTLNRDIHASEVVNYRTRPEWFNDTAVPGAAQTAVLTNNSTLADPATATGISFGEIAIGFDAAYPVGFYEDDFTAGYVVAPAGLQVTDTYPEPGVDHLARDLHGGMKNPRYDLYDHGLDGRNAAANNPGRQYLTALNAALSLPVSMTEHDTWLQCRSNINKNSEFGGTSFHPTFLKQQWGLHVVSSAPAANDYAPPIVGYDGTSARPSLNFDVATAVAAFPTALATAGQEVTVGADVARRVSRANFTAGMMKSEENRRHMTPAGITHEDGYGLKYAETLNAAGVGLIGDHTTTAEKEDILRGLMAWGFQWWNTMTEEGHTTSGNAGQNQYRPFPMLIYKALTGTTADIAQVATDFPACFFDQTFALTQAQVDAVMDPHGTVDEDLPKSPNDGLPYATIRREITAINGNDVVMANMSAEAVGRAKTNPKTFYRGMRLREEGGAEHTSEITAIDHDARTYTVSDASGFTVGDTVYVIPSYDAQVGDFEWAILNPDTGTNGNGLNFCASATYRNLLQWSGMVMAMRYLGFMPDDPEFEAWQGYVERANTPDEPLGDSYPPHHSTFRIGWADNGSISPRSDRDFWTAHWSTIKMTADAS